MVKKKNAEQDVGLVQMFNEMKKKHPDAMLLFRNGNFLRNVQGGYTQGIGDTGAEGLRQDTSVGERPHQTPDISPSWIGQASPQTGTLWRASGYLWCDRPSEADEETQGEGRGRIERNEHL